MSFIRHSFSNSRELKYISSFELNSRLFIKKRFLQRPLSFITLRFATSDYRIAFNSNVSCAGAMQKKLPTTYCMQKMNLWLFSKRYIHICLCRAKYSLLDIILDNACFLCTRFSVLESLLKESWNKFRIMGSFLLNIFQRLEVLKTWRTSVLSSGLYTSLCGCHLLMLFILSVVICWHETNRTPTL